MKNETLTKNASWFFILALIIAFGLYFLIRPKNPIIKTFALSKLPKPTEGEENEELREKYDSLRHRAAPGVDWKMVEANNMQNLAALAKNRVVLNGANGSGASATFAGGLVSGAWSERGANNMTGSIRSVDYVPATNALYTLSNGGSLWKSTLGTGSWVLQNQNIRFNVYFLNAFTKTGGGTRIITYVNQNLQYSDDDGATFTGSQPNYPIAWGGNAITQVIRLNDGSNTIYCLAYLWDPTPWAPRYWLYRSTDQGQTFSYVYAFPTVSTNNTITLCNPYNSTDVYAADINSVPGSAVFYSIAGTNVTNTYTSPLGASTNQSIILKGTKVAGTTTLYAMMNDNAFYKSINAGASWTQQGSTISTPAWDQMDVSMNDPTAVCYGEVNAYRSSNSAASWTQVNFWGDYYANPATKLHADIMCLQHFKKSDGTEFMIVDCHGGTYVSYDNLNTVANLSLNTHNALEYYDVLTDTLNPNRIFVGSQDQGFQRTLTGTTAGIQNFTQVISGDYGHLCLTYNNQILWAQYPGGTFYLYTDLGATNPTYIGGYSMQGTQKPNYGWMLPSISTINAAANEIWTGGGNITNGVGSYLSKLTVGIVSPFTITANQLSFDFRANSNNGTSGITAIEQSFTNPAQLYVATEDGTFFYSTNSGASWIRSNNFTGPTPWYLYGSTICSSHITPNLLWYGGTGYSNNAVFQSTDGGATFTAITNGLPGTLVEQIVANPSETMLFAATDAGPYVYIRSQNQWYSLQDATSPVQFYNSVEYLRASNIVRFGTMGRGIWDFKLNDVLPFSLFNFEGTLVQSTAKLLWQTTSEASTKAFVVQRSTDGVHFDNIGSVPAANNSTTIKNYSFNDLLPAVVLQQPVVYYRLQMLDVDGKAYYSQIISFNINQASKNLIVYPNPVKNQISIQVNTAAGNLQIMLFDATGKMVLQKELQAQNGTSFTSLDASSLAKGTYFLQVANGQNKWNQKIVKN